MTLDEQTQDQVSIWCLGIQPWGLGTGRNRGPLIAPSCSQPSSRASDLVTLILFGEGAHDHMRVISWPACLPRPPLDTWCLLLGGFVSLHLIVHLSFWMTTISCCENGNMSDTVSRPKCFTCCKTAR